MCYRLPLTSPNSLFICPKVGHPRNQGKWPEVAKGLWRNQRVLDTVRSKFASLSHLENQIFRWLMAAYPCLHLKLCCLKLNRLSSVTNSSLGFIAHLKPDLEDVKRFGSNQLKVNALKKCIKAQQKAFLKIVETTSHHMP